MRQYALVTVLFASVALAQGPVVSNKLAPDVPSPTHAIDMMLDMAHLKAGETLFDLGSGDGRILIAAAERHASAVGIEINPKLVQTATDKIFQAGVSDRAKVIQGDAMTADFSAANVVTLYMDRAANAKLRPQLEKFLKPGARVVSYDAEIPGWKAVRTEKTDERRGHTIYLYEVVKK